jgi:hypothetical protein
MFKKKCSHCNKKVEKEFDFCPYCANPTKDHKKEYGLLGLNDDMFEELESNKKPQKSFSLMDKLIGSAFNTAIKMVEKEMRTIDKQPSMPENLQLYINGKRINIPSQKIPNTQNQLLNSNDKEIEPETDEEGNPIKLVKNVPKISEEVLKKSTKLPRKEAKTKLTRFKDKVIYELDAPGISSLSNIVINKLEQSLEIKAYTEKAVFTKNISIKLPLQSYSVRGDKLFLEFKAQ